MEYKDFLDIYYGGPETTFKLFLRAIETNALLAKQVRLLSEKVTLQEERIKELSARLNKNSGNSSKPPSTDEFIKPKSTRKKSGKPPGGQKGHKGDTLKMTDTPDNIVNHRIKTCRGCGHSLEEVPPQGIEKRQVFDLPPLKIKVTEYQAESKVCPCCGLKNKASFPQGVGLPVQYGDNLKAFLVYLNQYQMTPYKRAVELIQDVYGHRLSQGTMFNAIFAVYEALEPVEEEIINLLVGASVVHLDETGIGVADKRQWLHVISTETLTYYAHHGKRGSKATDEIGILPRFKGLIVHDFWKPYLKYDCGHALCNAHHLRELTGILELNQQKWPQEMIELLLEIKATVEERKIIATELKADEIKSLEQRYDRIIEKGYLENPPPAKPLEKKRGRKKQSKAKNMLDRLKEHRRETLAFMYNFDVPFDNNLAERDLRMIKVKQKISGIFRSNQGAKMFCRVRGYISMARKNSIPIFDAIKSALGGKPFVPEF
jgi:transposase